ncbi:MAG: hypothetical protein WA304_05050 [Candidatus Cybelea sp.]
MKVSWAVVITLLVVALAQPVMFFLAWHYKLQTPLSDATELASIMGAIFTVGGLIVALVALYTQSNLEKAASNAISTALDNVRPQIDERIQTFLAAYSEFRSAQDMWARNGVISFGTVEDLVEHAESIEPSLKGLNKWMGLVSYEAAEKLFLIGRHFDANMQNLDVTLASAIASRGSRRLESAFDDERASNRSDTALLVALLHASLDDSTFRVTNWIRRAKSFDALPDMTSNMALSLFSCARSKQDCDSILAAYGAKGMSAEAIRQNCVSQPPQNGTARFVAFAHQPTELQNPPFNPTIIRFRTLDGWNHAFVEWQDANPATVGTRRGGIPQLPDFDQTIGAQGNPEHPQEFTELLNGVRERFTVLVAMAPTRPH